MAETYYKIEKYHYELVFGHVMLSVLVTGRNLEDANGLFCVQFVDTLGNTSIFINNKVYYVHHMKYVICDDNTLDMKFLLYIPYFKVGNF